MPASVKNYAAIAKVIFTWTSDGSGNATVSTTEALVGKVIGLTTIPTDSPTDNYDITVTDVDGHDVLLGAGQNRDTATTEHVASSSLGAVAHSRLTLNVSNAGSAKNGTVILYLQG